MTGSVPQVSIIALGVTTLVSSSPLRYAHADTPAQAAAAPSAPAPSLGPVFSRRENGSESDTEHFVFRRGEGFPNQQKSDS
jgi:hypothetical protein